MLAWKGSSRVHLIIFKPARLPLPCLNTLPSRPRCAVNCFAVNGAPAPSPSCLSQFYGKSLLPHSGKTMDAAFHMDHHLGIHSAHLALLKACGKDRALLKTKYVHAVIYHDYLEPNVVLLDHLVLAYAKCGALHDALHVLLSLPSRTVFAWTAVVSGYTDCGQAQAALEMYSLMREDDVQPNKYTFVSLFKACSIIGDLNEAQKAYADWQKHCLVADVHIGSTLVSMYGKCGSINDAEVVFVGMVERNIVVWNAMLSAYASDVWGMKGLLLYRQMQQEAVGSNQETLLMTLQACGALVKETDAQHKQGKLIKFVAVEVARSLHADARRKGSASDVLFSSTLVAIYGNCGSIFEAEQVFAGLVERNVVSWNVMLLAYVEDGQVEKALTLYRQMKEEGTQSTRETLVATFQACGAVIGKEEASDLQEQRNNHIFLKIGEALHADAHRSGVTSDLFVVNTLISMYGKCGSICQAETVFSWFSERDIITWNAMLSAYAADGQGEKVLHLYRQMQEDKVNANQQTFLIAVKVCGSLVGKGEYIGLKEQPIMVACLEIGKAVHADAKRENLASDVFIISTLVTMYAKCDSVVEAESVFDRLSECNAVCWNAMLSAYVDQRQRVNALRFYRQMLQEGMSPMQQTFLIILQACCALVEEKESENVYVPSFEMLPLKLGKALHADAIREGLIVDALVGNAFLSMYGKCRNISEVEAVFDGLLCHDSVSWSIILSAYIEQRQGEKALHLYRQMHNEGCSPNEETLVIALQACCSLLESCDKDWSKEISLEVGKALHADVQRTGLTANSVVGSTLVSLYGKCGRLLEAENVFDGLSECTAVSCCAMLSAYIEAGQGVKALQFYKQMQEKSVILDDITIVCILQVCVLTGTMDVCEETHFISTFAGFDLDALVTNTLIRAYGSCASMIEARATFDGLLQPEVVSWNACMAGYAKEGDSEASLQMFEEMQLAGVTPDRVTLLSLLSACSHASLVKKGSQHFESMNKDYGVVPEPKHYLAMIDLFGRAGDFSMVEIMLLRMAWEADLSLWMSLLHVCCGHGNIELGKQAFDHAVSLNPKEAAAFVMLANLYADAGLYQLANEVETLRQKVGT